MENYQELISSQSSLISQSFLEKCSDLNADVMVQKDACVIHESFLYGQSQRTTQRVLINAASENDRY